MAASSPERTVTPFPERIGRYELLLPIGSGGMATVFLARAGGVGGFEREVALKIIHAHLRADEESKLHLLDEAKLAARIRHPNVVPVIEVGDDPFGVYLVMDYVEGDSLAGIMRAAKGAKERLPLRLIARIMSDTLAGLHASHELTNEAGQLLGLVHRDYTPHNILVGIDGVSRLSDFSVAKAGERAVRTRTGLVKGKIGYMSPEQARGHSVDRRCDVWAAGVVAWELLAWRRLHKKPDAVATLLSVVTEPPPRLRDVAPDIPKTLDEVVFRALTMDVEQRIPSALELRHRLEEAFRAADGIAEQQEVGEFVARIFGPKLAERRARGAEVRQLRVRMEEIARPSSPHSELSPDLIAQRGELEDEDSGERTRPEPSLSTRELRAGPMEFEVPTGTTDSTLTVGLGTSTASRRRRVALAIAAAVALGAVGGFAAWSASGPSAPTPAAEPEAKRDSVAAQPVDVPPSAPAPTAEATQAAEDPEPAPEPAASAAPRKTAQARAPAVRHVPRAAPKRAAPEENPAKRAEPRSKAPTKLARDPYGEKP